MIIDFRNRQHLDQHIANHHQPQCDRQVDQSQRGGEHRQGKHPDCRPGLVIGGHSQPALSQRQAAQPFGHIGAAIPGAEQQQDIAGLDFCLTNMFGQASPLPRQAQQNGALPPGQPQRLGRAAIDAGGFRHHHLNDFQPFTGSGELFLARGVRKIQRQRGAKLVQRLGSGFDHQGIASLQNRSGGAAIAALAIADQSQNGHIRLFGVFVEHAKPFADQL